MANDIVLRVRQRAYEIWEREGRPQGREVDHWLQAERELADEDLLKEATRTGGRADEIGGPINEAAGDLTDDQDLKSSGEPGEAAGKIKHRGERDAETRDSLRRP